MRKLKLDVIWSAPQSYDAAPVEKVFGHLKLGELNSECQKTGKKGKSIISSTDFVAFPHIVNMIGRKMQEIPRSTRVRFWHRSSLELFKYLYFDKL